MGWRESLDNNQATFDNIRFFIDTASTKGGRRGTLHEYPFKDEPFAEDTGRKAKEFSINAFMFGDNYIVDLNILLNRLDSGEIGELNHPSLGKFQVKPMEYNVGHDGDVGGFETITIIFVEAGENSFPSPTTNTRTAFVKRKLKLRQDIQTEHEEKMVFSLGSGIQEKTLPDPLIDSSETITNSFIDEMERSLLRGERVLDEVDKAFDEIDKFRIALPTEIREPSAYMERTINLYDRMSKVWERAESQAKFDAFTDIFNIDISTLFIPSAIQTPARIQETKNNTLIESEFRVLALNEMSQASSDQEFVSNNQVTERRDFLLNQYDKEIELAGINQFEQMRRGLIDSRSAMIAEMNTKGSSLPDEKTVILNDTLSAFRLSQELYGEAFRGEEISDNNNIRHPLFLPPQVELDVLAS